MKIRRAKMKIIVMLQGSNEKWRFNSWDAYCRFIRANKKKYKLYSYGHIFGVTTIKITRKELAE